MWFQGLFVFMSKRYKGMFMETQGLWDAVMKQLGITLLVGFVFVRQSLSIDSYATKSIQ